MNSTLSTPLADLSAWGPWPWICLQILPHPWVPYPPARHFVMVGPILGTAAFAAVPTEAVGISPQSGLARGSEGSTSVYHLPGT